MQSQKAPSTPGPVLMATRAIDAETLLTSSVADFLATSMPVSPSVTYSDPALGPSRPASPHPEAST
ncbi:hypothetical protein C0991_009465, partial [Blastosporella zonata]